MRPEQLAQELGVPGKPLRAWLRRQYPRSSVKHGQPWFLTPEQVSAARMRFGIAPGSTSLPAVPQPPASSRRGRSTSDEAYVIDLCDEILGQTASRQHRFPWLLGDPNATGRRAALPVDAYYEKLGLVIEYRERQHSEPVRFFDKRQTLSGVGRGEQRAIYDQRRDIEVPEHGLRLVTLAPHQLDSDRRGRLRRNRNLDLAAVQGLLRR